MHIFCVVLFRHKIGGECGHYANLISGLSAVKLHRMILGLHGHGSGDARDSRYNQEIRSAPRRLDLNDTVVNEFGRSPIFTPLQLLESVSLMKRTSLAYRVTPAIATRTAAAL